jgi:hypothetical protein
MNNAPANELDLPPPTRPRSPLPAGNPRESGGVAKFRAMSAMEAALFVLGCDSRGIIASFVQMRQDKTRVNDAARIRDRFYVDHKLIPPPIFTRLRT